MKSLKSKINSIFINVLGINLKTIKSLIYFPKFFKDFFLFLSQGGKINSIFPILSDYHDFAGNIFNQYFIQDLHVSKLIYKNRNNFDKHLDVGSRLDGFVSTLSVFSKVDVFDIRPLKVFSNNVKFIQKDFIKETKFDETRYKSISCLHSIEHFGLGRYSDKINKDGPIIGFKNLYSLLENKGFLYLSFPISSKPRVEFNAHRIFSQTVILEWISTLLINDLDLVSFDYIDDKLNLHINQNIEKKIEKLSFGCGIFTMRKK